MGIVLATTGSTHITELNGGGSTTNDFDAIELGSGNDTPAAADDRSNLSSKIASTLVQVSTDYPQINDSDTRNDGRGSSTYTWKFEVPEGVSGFIASNGIVTNYASGLPGASEPILAHFDEVVSKRTDQVAIIFVNVTTLGAPNVVIHVEDGDPLTEQLVSYSDRVLMGTGLPGAYEASSGRLASEATEGQSVWTGARLLRSGALLRQDDVLEVRLDSMVRAGETEWETKKTEVFDVTTVVYDEPQRTDARWKHRQGYTFGHEWTPEFGWGPRSTRLRYSMLLSDGTERVMLHDVRFHATGSGT